MTQRRPYSNALNKAEAATPETAQAASATASAEMSRLILRRSPIGDNQEDYDVLENGVVVGRIFFLDAVGPPGRPWMWASGHSADSVKRAAHGYEATREAAMAAFS